VPPADAVSVAFWVDVTAVAVAVNPALLVPAGTVIEEGTVTALSLLPRLTARPLLPAAAVSVTVQASVPAPVNEPLLHDSPFNTPGAVVPVPLRLTTAVAPVDALLLRVRAPVAAPAAAGSNLTCTVAVAPGFNVTGKLAPDMLKPVPVTTAALTVSGAVPDEVIVTVCAPDTVFTTTLPKLRLVVLSVSAGTSAISCTAQVFVLPPAVAVRVAVCVEETAEAAALNVTLVAPAATVAVDGTVSALLLLARFTVSPLLPAAAVSVTVQASVAAPVSDALVQDKPLSVPGAVVPVPLRPTTVLVPAAASLVIVNDPAIAPAVVGSNWTCRVAVPPGLSARGKLAPDMLKPAPFSAAVLIVRAAVPEEVRVSFCVADVVFTVTSPKLRLDALTVSAAEPEGGAGSS
jgi:hypothetical protein